MCVVIFRGTPFVLVLIICATVPQPLSYFPHHARLAVVACFAPAPGSDFRAVQTAPRARGRDDAPQPGGGKHARAQGRVRRRRVVPRIRGQIGKRLAVKHDFVRGSSATRGGVRVLWKRRVRREMMRGVAHRENGDEGDERDDATSHRARSWCVRVPGLGKPGTTECHASSPRAAVTSRDVVV